MTTSRQKSSICKDYPRIVPSWIHGANHRISNTTPVGSGGNDNPKRGVTSKFHDTLTAGHPGIAKTMTEICKYYWWPGIRDFVTEYIKGCATCQMNKVNTHPTKPPLYPITAVPDALPFQTIALDFITKLPESLGNDTILTITDHDCSKASIFIPCKEAIDSEGVAKLYMQHV